MVGCSVIPSAMSVAAKPRSKKSRPSVAGKNKGKVPQAAALLAWYDRHRRTLPWRATKGERPDPYRVWLSEVMLQQTTVRAVAPYYERFLQRFGDVETLAAAPLEDVLAAWAGLGYYARARNLHACARAVVERCGGKFPAAETELRSLPGIGDYTAAAIAAIAFDLPASPVDGNIERVVARLFAVEEPLPAVKPRLRQLARALTPPLRAGDFAQAMMDLGSTICTPKRPACALCPWNDGCAAFARGDAETLPRRTPKRDGALRRGAAFVARRADGHLLVRTRPLKGLLGGMTEVPTTAWVADFDEGDALRSAPRFSSPLPSAERSVSGESASGVRGKRSTKAERAVTPLPQGGRGQPIVWRRIPGVVRHVFTHFPLELSVYVAEFPAGVRGAPSGARWIRIENIADEALPSLMRKVLAHALGDI
jgi:A/G-specific adenine glycosylase